MDKNELHPLRYYELTKSILQNMDIYRVILMNIHLDTIEENQITEENYLKQ